jgi:anti-sigma factor ChrR (cupin superfamily)
MYQIIVRQAELDWSDLEIPGVSMKVLHKDEATGAMTVMTRMRAGATIPAHWHTKADEAVYVLEGDFVENGVSFGPGSYFAGKARTSHGPHSTVRGCVVLTRFSAEFDFQTSLQASEA